MKQSRMELSRARLGPEPGWRARRQGPRSLFCSSAFPSLPPRPPAPAGQLGRPPLPSRLPRRCPGESARRGVRRSRGRCQQRCRRAHSRTVARPLLWPAPSRPHAPRPPSAVQPSPPQRPSRRRGVLASTQTHRSRLAAPVPCNPSLSQKLLGGARFPMAAVRARSFSHTTWAAFLSQPRTL